MAKKTKPKDEKFRPIVPPFRPDRLLPIKPRKPLAGQMDFFGGVHKPKRKPAKRAKRSG